LPDTLLDTSLYVAAIRRGDDGVRLLQRLSAGASLWLSAVVLEELYAGAGERSKARVAELERDFARADRIVVPTLEDWIRTGEVLNRLALRYGYEQIGRGRLTNDALIAMSAAGRGIRIITANEKDFRRLSEFRTFEWEVTAI
jgi:predicted nucleic acid-binding protein